MHHRAIARFGATAAIFGAFLVLTILISGNFPASTSTPPDAPTEVETPAHPSTDEYGIETSDFEIVERSIRRNETFADILTKHNVSYASVVTLADASRPIFNVRSLRAGSPIRLYVDSLETARFLVYQKSAVDYVVFDIAGDTAAVYEGRREVKTERRRLAGSIENSLYRTLEEQDLSGRLVPELAMSLSEVFAWQVDFFRIMQGDDFSVIYEERSIDGESIGIGRIVAARFGHRGTNYFGIYFERGDRPDFYDEEGNSLRKALLKAPLKFRRISSRYTQRRFHPVQQRYKAHLGTDYAADTGTPIYSVGDGVILEARFARYNGNYVKVRHNSTYTTGYLHMSRIASGIRPGVAVKQGQVIGYVGSTGLATGPHVCYRYWKNGVQIDPFTDDIPPAHPVDPNLRDEFMITRNQLLPLLLEPTSPHYAERVTVGTYGALL